ncbi:MAG: tRNA preQ1(34) S-adenosylmethionine ribosyltransferase-isomerase QueA [Magnetococcales bacterium]|nr:tRNA preQ1(34) S-adenosylmethionine ribosyltransferase-isomerase QueA [Magnetococcales bacterium]MBF0321378.1 tRNA preQ1(34) S-adenosylmethionine ribosyltransferase-isomerase QueA [Magnetococcales bacterium]
MGVSKGDPCWRLEDFDYTLPRERIAQTPAEPRDAARLLVSHPHGMEDRIFQDLVTCLQPGDLLVQNDTQVLPARLVGRRVSGGRVEILLLRPETSPGTWQALLGANKPIRPGWRIEIAPEFQVEVLERLPGCFRVHLETPGEIMTTLARHGQIPLPPYIASAGQEIDRLRYQTMFASQPGAVAAPTAGLHFTMALLARLEKSGIGVVRLTLHVGPGTFQPVRVRDLRQHVMHREWCQLPPAVVERIQATRARGGRVIAVGTTTVRTLESAVDERGELRPFTGETALFILPGFRFRVVDAMITNFHLPRSTLLMLVAAFVGKTRLERIYAHAIAQGYRFYSYGDACLLFPETTSQT